MGSSLFDFTRNYFQLFNLEPTFEIDTVALTQRYRDIQHQIHPDRFAGKNDQNQRMAVQFTSYVNEAFQCLKQPLERAKYLLELRGVAVNLDTQSHVDSDFLMAQIELREQLEQVAAQKNQAAAIKQLQKQISDKIDELSLAFASAYQQDNNPQAQDAVVKWQFLAKLQHDVTVLEDNLL